MLATPDHGNSFTGNTFSAPQGASFLVAGLMEVASEIESLRVQGQPQEIPPGRAEEGEEGPNGALLGAAFATGALLPMISHATSLGLGAALKLLFLAVTVAPAILSH